MRLSKFSASCTALLAIGTTLAARGSSIDVTYAFAGLTGTSTSVSVQTQPARAVFSDLTRGSGVTPASASKGFNSTSWNTPAIDLTAYYAFGFTLDSGSQISVGEIDVTLLRSGTGPVDFELRSSLDSFTSDIVTISPFAPSNITADTLKLSLGPAFDNLTSDVTFKLYAYGTTNSGGTLRIDATSTPGLEIKGSLGPIPTPVPLPLASGMALPVLLALIAPRFLRRRPLSL